MSSEWTKDVFVTDRDGRPKACSVLVDGAFIKVIEAVADGPKITVIPGFIDVHNHGAVGVDVNAADLNGLLKVAAFLAQNGVTAWMPTLVPDSDENYSRVVAAV